VNQAWRAGLVGLSLALIAGATWANLAVAETGKPAAGAGRFLGGLFSRPERPPQLIAVPAPPPDTELPALAREAAKRAPAGQRAPQRAPLGPAHEPGTTDRPPAENDVADAAEPPRGAVPRSWPEVVGLATALAGVGREVAADALDPAYRPKPRAIPVTTVTVKPTSRRTTPPLVVTQLEPTGAPPPKTARFDRLRRLISDTLASYRRRPLNTAEHTPWEVMHGFIAFGIPTQVQVGGPGGELVNAIGWSNMGGRCRGQSMLTTRDGRLKALKGFGVQGHSAQYLAILAQCRVAAASPILVDSREFTVADLIEEEKQACRAKTELTFTLISMAHYLPSDAAWSADDGQEWSLPKLVEEELVQPIRGAPCGGTHRLFGLAYACQRRLRATGSLDGVYLRADRYVRDYQQLVLAKLCNRDGSFSTEWFKYPADRADDLDRKIQTTGHILEWLAASLDQERLYDGRVVAAAEFLATALAREPSRTWKIGPLGHALHSLSIYQERAWGVVLPGGIAAFHGPMKAAPVQVAEQPKKARRR